MKKPVSIDEAAAKFDRDAVADRRQKAESERQKIVALFPIGEWPTLPLDRYALGQAKSEDSFCRWMEFRSQSIASMKGGSARKHIIYKKKKASGWYFDKSFKSVESAWKALRTGFVEALEFGQSGDWEQIDAIEALYGCFALRMKTIYVYFPDDVLPVCSIAHIKHFLHKLDPEFQDSTTDVVRLNRLLRENLMKVKELKGWSTWEMAVLLYEWADPREMRRIVKIAPGEKARYWEDCRAEGYICVGWDDVGDLTEFENKEEFREAFEECYDYAPTKLTVKVNELWTLRELEPGDIILANRGISHVLAVGEVQEPGYEFRPDRSEFKHTVHVKWDTSVASDVSPQRKWAFTTVSKVSLPFYEKLVKGKPIVAPPAADPAYVEIAEAMDRKGQVILYGPPGTGKTYHARRVAVWRLLRERGEEEGEIAAILDDHKLFLAKENSLSNMQISRRTWYVVANPKEWSWRQLKKEGTVEYRYGRIQRNYALVQPGDLVIGYQAGRDKQIAAVARVTRGLGQGSEDKPTIELEHVHDVKDGLTYDELLADPVLKDMEPMKFRNQGTLFALSEREAEHLFSLLIERDPALQTHVEQTESVGQLTRVTFHPSYSYEDFIEGFRPVKNPSREGLQLDLEDGIFKRVCRQAQLQPNKRFIILIDEINRANISKVLGELITLLELDKRGLVVTLSQSKDVFSVPPNVSIIGTMNTSDRSIRLLDAALRRRFAFIEMMPEAELFQGIRIGQLALDEFVLGLNSRISERFGREKQVGHSFFMLDAEPIADADTFAVRFRQDVLPLLQEYCFDDFVTLAELLGKNLVDVHEQKLNTEILRDSERLVEELTELYGPAGEEDRE